MSFTKKLRPFACLSHTIFKDLGKYKPEVPLCWVRVQKGQEAFTPMTFPQAVHGTSQKQSKPAAEARKATSPMKGAHVHVALRHQEAGPQGSSDWPDILRASK